MDVRLDSYLAHLGVASRRGIADALKRKTVTVNDVRILEPGVRVDPAKDRILVDGRVLSKPKFLYYLVNKPVGIVSTVMDEKHRKSVRSLVPKPGRIYPVGRLDKDTSGLIILTNDGELTNKLTHPRFHVAKTYRLTIKGLLFAEKLEKLRTGVRLDDGMTLPARVVVKKDTKAETIADMTITEGRNRQIRRMCEMLRIPLISLQRVQFGPIALDKLPEGKYRELSRKEVEALYASVK